MSFHRHRLAYKLSIHRDRLAYKPLVSYLVPRRVKGGPKYIMSNRKTMLTLEEFASHYGFEPSAVEHWITSGALSKRNGLVRLNGEPDLIDPFKFARCYPLRWYPQRPASARQVGQC